MLKFFAVNVTSNETVNIVKEIPSVPSKSRVQEAIEQAASRFAEEILSIVRSATLDELAAMTTEGKPAPRRRGRPPKVAAAEPPKRRGRPPKKAVAAQAQVEDAPAPKKARKKRKWPTCTVDGCGKNVYMPSGDKKMCYQHHIEAGGAPSPLVKARQKKAGAAKAPARKKTVRRKKGETLKKATKS